MPTTRLAYIGPEDYTEEQLIARLQEESPEIISIDVETVSIKDRTLIGIGIGLNQREAIYVSILPVPSQYLDLILRIILRAKTRILHNGIFDLTVMIEAAQKQRMVWEGVRAATRATSRALIDALCTGLADTSLMGQVQGVPSVQLAEMSHRYLGEDIQMIADILPKGKNMLSLDWGVVANKCLHDCLTTIRLWYKMRGKEWASSNPVTWRFEPYYGGIGCDSSEPTTYTITQAMKDCYNVDIKLVPLLLRMSQRGIRLRPHRVRDWYEKLSYQLLAHEDTCTRLGFNPASNQQVGYVLASRGSFLPWTRGKKRQLKVDEDTLLDLDDPLATIILEHRKLNKLVGTYIRPCLNEFRFYTHYRQDLSTMRLASFDRNVQNIPPKIRDIFEPESGTWSWTDANQIEMRIVAYASKDPLMVSAYNNGGNIHEITESRLWGRHSDDTYLSAKTFNYAMLYRAMAKTLAKHTRLPVSNCAVFREEWLGLYKGVDQWQLETIEHGWEYGWSETLFGRRCRLPPVEQGGADHVEKCAVNYIPQGTGADVIKRAMLICDEGGVDQVAQVHDEILADGMVNFPEEVLSKIHPELFTPFETKHGPVWS